jgi:16S rRNA G966 N2-methylase RsmD
MTDKKQISEYEKESSLTDPLDRDLQNRWRPEQSVRPLTDTETDEAMKALNNTDFVRKFPSVDRTYADPPIPLQNIALLSFVPAKGATPNENGVFGFAKVRGTYSTPFEADQRAEYLIRNVDSYHHLYHLYVGRPFPITSSSKYSAETKEIDIRKETTKVISENIKEVKNKEQKTINEMKEREEALLAESDRARNNDGVCTTDPYEDYITLCVKKAQLSWTFLEHLKKLDEVRNIILKTRANLKKLDDENPEFKEKYFEKYMEARKQAGLDENIRDVQDNFMRYMVEDVDIPTIDTDEVLPTIKEKKVVDLANDDAKVTPDATVTPEATVTPDATVTPEATVTPDV